MVVQLAVIVMADADGAAYARRTTARTRSKGPIRRRVRCSMSKPAQEERHARAAHASRPPGKAWTSHASHV